MLGNRPITDHEKNLIGRSLSLRLNWRHADWWVDMLRYFFGVVLFIKPRDRIQTLMNREFDKPKKNRKSLLGYCIHYLLGQRERAKHVLVQATKTRPHSLCLNWRNADWWMDTLRYCFGAVLCVKPNNWTEALTNRETDKPWGNRKSPLGYWIHYLLGLGEGAQHVFGANWGNRKNPVSHTAP